MLCIVALTAGLNGCGARAERAAKEQCIRNLMTISGAKDRYAMEHDGAPPATMQDLLPYMEAPVKCPKDGTYTIGGFDDLPTCTVPGHALEPAATP